MKLSKIKKPEEVLNSETVANLINDLKTKWGEEKITVGTIHLVLKEGMELVDKYNCPGTEKKEHVLTIVKAVVKDLVVDETEERIILELIDKKVLENTMDLIIQAARGQLNIKNKATQKKIMSCTRSCIPILIDSITRIIALVKASKQPAQQPTQQPAQQSATTNTSINGLRPSEIEIPK